MRPINARSRSRIAAGAMAATLLVACATDTRHAHKQSVVIVTLDTTRADYLPMYGSGIVQTPAMDRLAREGVVFDRAESVAPLTLTAHTSLFTGLYPPRHGVRDNAAAPLTADHPTLAEILHGQGWHTAAFVGASVLAADRGLSRGFDVYDDGGTAQAGRSPRRPANEVIDGALAWLFAASESPFLLWVHLYDAHAPQSPPDEYRRAYPADQYSAGIAFADSQLGRLLDALDRQPSTRDTIVVVAGDHGESLGDHGEFEHGIFLYESALHVPLVVRAPDVRRGHIQDLVSLVDVTPTVLGLLGIRSVASDGVSLVASLCGRDGPATRWVYAESMYPRHFGWSALRAMRDTRYKFIEAPRPELYDLDADPFEDHNLASVQPDVVARMRARLGALDTSAKAADPRSSREVPAALRARLMSIGYVSGAASPAAGEAPDPKDFIQLFNAVRHHEGR